MFNNTLICTDVYKMGHMEQYPDDVTEVYSYLEARKKDKHCVFFGLQYYLEQYLTRDTIDVYQFACLYEQIIGTWPNEQTQLKLEALRDLYYWPIEIKAVPEGTRIANQNVLMTIRNTVPGFHWCVGLLESLLLKVWNTCTVAEASVGYAALTYHYAWMTCDDYTHLKYQVHEFGYRGASSEETAAISGAAHLLSFLGSDNVPAVAFLHKYYGRTDLKTKYAASVPATEHSVMCSYGKDGEFNAFNSILEKYPTGIVSIVSDTYDLWNVLTRFVDYLKDDIMKRDGKVVFRPDSGIPELIICGDPKAPEGSPERAGALQLLWEKFGGTTNSKGYKVLDPHVGLIYGDGMTMERFEAILQKMTQMGFASSNLVIGVGGILIQSHNRDELGFALKATRVVRNGKAINIFKDPITDPSKKSKTGLMMLDKNAEGYFTKCDVSEDEEKSGLLVPVYRNGEILKRYSIEEVRANLGVM